MMPAIYISMNNVTTTTEKNMTTEKMIQAAFDRCDTMGFNHVTLKDLRAALPSIPRAELDKEIARLREEKIFTLDQADGRHCRLSDAEREAGIVEGEQILVYIARRG
jgi:hypothetical protein